MNFRNYTFGKCIFCWFKIIDEFQSQERNLRTGSCMVKTLEANKLSGTFLKFKSLKIEFQFLSFSKL